MKSFVSAAGRKVTDVREFLREASSTSTIRYTAEKGAKHLIYIPYVNVKDVDENGNEIVRKQIIAISGNVHEWTSPDGKYRATVCMKDVVRKGEDGTMLNDGSCPFCERIKDAWDIYNYRKNLEEANCKLTGPEREKHMQKVLAVLADERKAKPARTYMYILVVKFKNEGKNLVIGEDGLPEYELKVMKLSASRVEKIEQIVQNAGSQLPGCELLIEYPATDDKRLQVSQSTIALVFPDNMQTRKYPGLLNRIAEDVQKFTWEGIEKAFPEWEGMTVAEAKNIMNQLFEQWDRYKEELKVNPNARYLEYVTPGPTVNPALNAGTDVGAIPNIPLAPNVPDINQMFGGDSMIKI